MPQQAVQFAAIQEEAKRAANVYNALEQKYNDALVAKTTAISDIIVVQPASADAAVKRPSLRTNLAIAFIVGLLLGLAVVYVLDADRAPAAGRGFARSWDCRSSRGSRPSTSETSARCRGFSR